ncbi:MAG: hypothetical protein KC618_09270 [Candidatus Omnitrophica bacterium]|nr:hypothetical protein [Candidatus Omnitrophota bacterium]
MTRYEKIQSFRLVFGQRCAAGYVVEEGWHLFVGTGVGTSILPVRFRVVPEILILTVNREAEG